MIYVFILIGVLLISQFLLYRMLFRMIKYQNFKSNVILRLTLGKEFEEYKKSNEAWEKRETIVKKIVDQIDEEIDESPIWDWKDLITAINAETYFKTDVSEPIHSAFFPKEIIERHEKRNKEAIKNGHF